MYKWMPLLLKDYRQHIEETSGQPLDMPPHCHETTRYEVLWESTLPLAMLYSPLVILGDTFVLQEHFIPRSRFQDWIREARPIYEDIDLYQRHGVKDMGVAPQSVVLLNITIRFVEQYSTMFLLYSPRRGGAYASVLYFRIKRAEEVERDLGIFDNRLAELMVSLGSTCYLPYRNVTVASCSDWCTHR